MEKKNDLCERLLQFAVDVILYLRTVKNTVETMDTKRQLIKASTSSGANYEESQGSPTKPKTNTRFHFEQTINSLFLFLGLWTWNLGLGTFFTQEFIYVT